MISLKELKYRFIYYKCFTKSYRYDSLVDLHIKWLVTQPFNNIDMGAYTICINNTHILWVTNKYYAYLSSGKINNFTWKGAMPSFTAMYLFENRLKNYYQKECTQNEKIQIQIHHSSNT